MKTKIYFGMAVLSMICALVGCRFDNGVLRALPLLGIMLLILSISLIVESNKSRKKRRRSH